MYREREYRNGILELKRTISGLENKEMCKDLFLREGKVYIG